MGCDNRCVTAEMRALMQEGWDQRKIELFVLLRDVQFVMLDAGMRCRQCRH